MRTITATVLATSLIVSNAIAAPRSVTLPAGKPAGVKEAAVLGPNALLIFLGGAVVIGGLVLTLSNPSDGVTTPTTTAASTTSLP